LRRNFTVLAVDSTTEIVVALRYSGAVEKVKFAVGVALLIVMAVDDEEVAA
jgi:hypothetical protein